MNSRVLAPLFALLIFAAHLNCVLEHRLGDALQYGSSLITQLVDSSQGNSPVGNPLPTNHEDCEHGCICKGATLADHFASTDFASSELHFFFASLLSNSEWTTQPLFESDDAPQCLDWCLPLRASDRCALLQSFLI